MKKIIKTLSCVALLAATLPSQAAIINFDFTGRLIVADPTGMILINNESTYTDISASLSYDTNTGLGNSGLSITMNGADFLGTPPTFHSITMERQADSNLINGQVLVDWSGTYNMPLHVQWDATGLFNAIKYGSGLQAGDVLSGSTLYHDANGNGVQDSGEFLTDIGSATPYSDSLSGYIPHVSGGAAPMAATSASLGLAAGTPFPGFKGYFDIGTGNSMHVTSVSAVPVPAAVWLFGSGLVGLFGSGLIGLVGFAKRK